MNELKTDHIFTDAPIFDDVAYLAQYSGISILVGSTITLSSMSIWPRAFPNPYHEFWARLKAGLLAIPDENWQVWTDWYDDRLKGHPANEQHELARALLPNELWQQGPKVVNARIAEILAQKEEPPPLTPPPKIPATRPGALEPEWVEGRLVLPASLRRPSRLDELAALRNQLLRLAEALDAEANIDPRIRIYLRQIAANVPEKAPTQLQVFQIGHDLAAITGYAATVTAEWPELLAQRYHAMAIAFDRTMRKFPRWVAFLRNSPKKHEEQVDAAKLGEVVASMGAALRDDIAKERISEEIPEAYELLTQPIVSRDAWRKTITEGNDLLIGDVLESTNNILKRLAEYAVAASNATSGSFIGRAAGEYAKKYQKSFIKKAGDHGEKDGAATVKWIKRILIGSIGSGTAWLIATRPEMFGWLGAVLKFLQ